MRPLIAISIYLATVVVAAADEPRMAARINPAEMFTGELKKLEPHLGLTASGCVKVDPNGKSRNFHVRLELWENGKRSDKPLGGPGLSLTSGSPFELSISVREDPGRFAKPMYRVTYAWAGGGAVHSAASRVEVFDTGAGETAFHPRRLEKSVELREKGSVAVWGLLAGAVRDVTGKDGESIEEMVKRVPWALVLRFTSEEK